MLLVVAAACDGVALQGHNETAAAFTSCRKYSNETEVLKHREPRDFNENCVRRFLKSQVEMPCFQGEDKKVMEKYLS